MYNNYIQKQTGESSHAKLIDFWNNIFIFLKNGICNKS